MKMIVTRKTMISRKGATPSGAAGGATHILLRIGKFASSPRKRGSSGVGQKTLGSRFRGNDDIGDVMDFQILNSKLRGRELRGARAFAELSRPATIDSATLAFFAVFPSP
jgi:hypothetical protein